MLWKDIELGDRETPSLYSAGKDFEGEPNSPIRREFVIFVKNQKKYESMMLNRLQNDCKTHLDLESKYAYRLSESGKKATIEEMKKLWNGFEDHEKPNSLLGKRS
ncbi:LPD11 domain-containing protein [Paenibacillus sp. FSL H8-0104]|uniref:LPD11 domain-containing protein n=1 Tax=Paenibacillus sp. FSL H8-0104 TaxID=2954509 RepID=UPI0030FD6C79